MTDELEGISATNVSSKGFREILERESPEIKARDHKDKRSHLRDFGEIKGTSYHLIEAKQCSQRLTTPRCL